MHDVPVLVSNAPTAVFGALAAACVGFSVYCVHAAGLANRWLPVLLMASAAAAAGVFLALHTPLALVPVTLFVAAAADRVYALTADGPHSSRLPFLLFVLVCAVTFMAQRYEGFLIALSAMLLVVPAAMLCFVLNI